MLWYSSVDKFHKRGNYFTSDSRNEVISSPIAVLSAVFTFFHGCQTQKEYLAKSLRSAAKICRMAINASSSRWSVRGPHQLIHAFRWRRVTWCAVHGHIPRIGPQCEYTFNNKVAEHSRRLRADARNSRYITYVTYVSRIGQLLFTFSNITTFTAFKCFCSFWRRTFTITI